MTLLGDRACLSAPFALLPALALACVPSIVPDADDGESSADSTDGSTSDGTTVGTTGTSVGTTGITSVTTVADTSVTTVADTSVTVTATATDGDTSLETATDGDTEVEPLPDCPGVGLGPLAVGEACTANDECISALCTIFTDAPLNADAFCDVPPADCSMRITGTSRDIVTGQALPGSEMRALYALQAVTDPVNAPPEVTGTSDANGRIDVVTDEPPSGPIGLFALLEGPGYHLTTTVLTQPPSGDVTYGVANDVHDLWLVSSDALAAWSAMLASDPAVPPGALPLGLQGGVVGLVRDSTGAPVSGATVTSDRSAAFVRYLANDGTFNSIATGDLGLFVILEPALAEQFEAVVDGVTIGNSLAISAENAIFTLVFTAP